MLTKKELDIVKCVLLGLSNEEIGKRLFISVHTVKLHLENLYRKFDVHNKIQLAVYAILKGFVNLDDIQFTNLV